MLLKQSTIHCGVRSDSAGLSTHHGAIIVYMHGQARDFLSSLVKYIYIYTYVYIYISTIDPSFGVIWRFPEKGVPLNHPFIDGFSIINIYKPSILGYPHDYGNLHMNYVSLFLYQLSHSKLQKPAFPQPQRSTFADDLASNVVAVVRICKVTSMAG